MKTWNDYKEHIRLTDSSAARDLEEIEKQAQHIATIIEQHSTDSRKKASNL